MDLSVNDIVFKMEKPTTDCKKISVNHIFNQRLESKQYEPSKCNKKKKKSPN